VEEARTCTSRNALPARGFFFPPTYFTHVAQSHRIAPRRSSPVLAVMSFRTPDEAVEKANNLAYGLSAGSGRTRARRSSR